MRYHMLCKLGGPVERFATLFMRAKMCLQLGRETRRRRGGHWSQGSVAYEIAPRIRSRVVVASEVELVIGYSQSQLIQADLLE